MVFGCSEKGSAVRFELCWDVIEILQTIGQEDGAEPLPETFQYPTMEEMAEQVRHEIRKFFVVIFFNGAYPTKPIFPCKHIFIRFLVQILPVGKWFQFFNASQTLKPNNSSRKQGF